jgi:hypothetical protein
MFKRAMSSCANCSNNQAKISFLTKYRNVARARKISWNHDTEKEKWNHESKQEWFSNADRLDYRMMRSLIVGSTILGGFIGGKEIYDGLEKDPKNNYTINYENYELRKNIGIGSLAGAVGGSLLWVAFPYPLIITTIGTGAFLYDCGPRILRAIKFRK